MAVSPPSLENNTSPSSRLGKPKIDSRCTASDDLAVPEWPADWNGLRAIVQGGADFAELAIKLSAGVDNLPTSAQISVVSVSFQSMADPDFI